METPRIAPAAMRRIDVRSLPGAEKRVPPRALLWSVAALAVAAWGAWSSPEILGGYDALSWLLAVVPAFQLAYYRGWRGALRAQAAGIALVLVGQLVAEYVLGLPVDWWLLFLVAVALVGIGLGMGVVSELLQRERAAAILLAYTDPLTGLPNRRLLEFVMAKEFAAAQRGRFLTVVLFDVDGFKAYNAGWGYRLADDALRRIASALDANTRQMNLTGRFGGDEYLSILSGEKPAGARVFAERVRRAVRELDFEGGGRLTVSAGIATYEPSLASVAELLDAADRALQRAKALGGDRTVVHVGETGLAESWALEPAAERDPERRERTWTRRAMEEAEARYRSLYSEVPVALYRTSPAGRVLDANRALVRLLGFPDREACLGANAFDLYADPEDRRRWQSEMEARGVVRGFEVRLRRQDGREIWVRDTARAVTDEHGRVAWYEGALEDITERKEAEAAAREAADRVRRILDHIADAFIAVDDEWRITFVNAEADRYLRRLGTSRDALLGRVLWDAFPAPKGSPGPERLRKAKEERTPVRYETFFETLGLHLDVHAYPTPDGLALQIRDVTGRKRAEAAVARAEEQLRLSQRLEAIGQLAGGIAHDFNNLLTAVLGNVGLLLADRGPDDPIYPELVEIRKAAERATALTRQLLAFSRRQVLHPRVLSLNDVVTELHGMLRRLIGEHIELEVALAPDLGHVRADPGQMEQVIVNLVVNARDAMPDGGRVTIETANAELDEEYARRRPVVRPGAYVRLAVTDTGTGIDEAIQGKIFEPFFTTKGVGKGTGLGLATVYGIVKHSDGYIWVYSEPGKGTTFKVYLPRVDAPPDRSAALPEPGRLPRGHETVLVVEDQPSVRRLVRDVLQRAGYTVLEAEDPDGALALVQRYGDRIDLLLTDLVLPELPGPRLAERVRELRPGVRVLYISGYPERAAGNSETLEPGAALLEKPFSAEALARRVRTVLDGDGTPPASAAGRP